MQTLYLNRLTVTFDFQGGQIYSLQIDNKERLVSHTPIFSLRLRDKNGEAIDLKSTDAKKVDEYANMAVYYDFSNTNTKCKELFVTVSVKNEKGEAAFYIKIDTPKELVAEWIDYPNAILPLLEKNNENGTGGKILFPYNEGAIVSDIEQREETGLRHEEPIYPSKGSYAMFPNMICSQMLAYLWGDSGLYIGVHDPHRAPKAIDFYPSHGGVALQTKLFCGVDFGETFLPDYPIVWSVVDGFWESAAERYRKWFEATLPKGVCKISENTSLPRWYQSSPLIVSYPVRGVHDQDKMNPNKLFPYNNALPIIDEIAEKTDSELMVLLMHWEGTAPWAPPYVWPPYGGADCFKSFYDELHKRGHLLGVYCSGFGYTLKSNLVDDYDRSNDYENSDLSEGMCASPEGVVKISNICQAQRSGYDICPASSVGKELLGDSYGPLFENAPDYVQILDQNHGGGQYFCYSREHGHPPVPGKWMTENMQELLTEWNKKAEGTLFGCESAAAEPFIGNLLFSDNRFELNYKIGMPVPLYSYIYHEYVRNFMGNQVSCPFRPNEDTLRFRIAYSFVAGDCMTLVISEDGEPLSHWGMKDFSVMPDKQKALTLIKNLTSLYKSGAKDFLYSAKMIPCPTLECESIIFNRRDSERKATLPTISAAAYEDKNGRRALILVNPTNCERQCKVMGESITVPALDGIILNI